MESRVEMHSAQITKMQKALEQADQEKARVEQDLEVALRAMQSLKSVDPSDQQVPIKMTARSVIRCRSVGIILNA